MFLLRKGFYSAVRKKEKTHREKDPRHLAAECGGAETGIPASVSGKRAEKCRQIVCRQYRIRYNKKRYAVRESGGLYLRRCGREIVKKSGGGQR